MPDLENGRKALSRLLRSSEGDLGGGMLLSYATALTKLPARIREIMEAEEGNKKLILQDLDYSIPDNVNDYDHVSEVKDRGEDLTIPLKGRFALFEDGNLVEVSGPKTVAKIPFPTRDGNFVLGGAEFTMRRQLRLSPGVYVGKGRDNRVHAMLNTGTKQNADIYLDPETSKMTFRIGQKAFPLDVALKASGISDELIQKTLGKELYDLNASSGTKYKRDVDRLYSVMFRGERPQSTAIAEAAIRKQLSESSVDPWVTGVTLGKEYSSLGADLLMDTTKKMVDVAAVRVEPDNREQLHFKVPFDVGTMVDYALQKSAPTIQHKLKMRLRDAKDIDSIITRPLTTMNSILKSKYNQDELSNTPDQYNPFGMHSDSTEVTLMGEGGLRSNFTITNEARDISESATGIIDPIHSPEGSHLGVNMHLTNRARIVGNNLFITGMYDKNGASTITTPREYYGKAVALPGQIMFKGGKPILGNDEVDVVYKGKITSMPANRVDMVMGGNHSLNFGASGIVPFVNYDMGSRVSARQMSQAVPLVGSEAPLVRSMGAAGATLGSEFYKRMNPTTPKDMPPGVVIDVKENAVTVLDDSGEKHRIPIRKDYQLNGHASIRDTPIVKVGDRVTSGQVVAENQFSRDGELALGKNLDVAFIPYHGLNFKDGLVISESAAKKMTSEHSYRHDYSKGRNDVYDLGKYVSHYPNRYNKEQIERLGEDGVIKPGMVVNPGDPIALKLSTQELTEDDVVRGNISKAFKSPLRDDAKTWDGDFPAVVKKVVKTSRGINVVLGTTEPMQVGDKMVGYHGQRGVIAHIVPDKEMPKYEDGSIPDVLQNPAAVPSRMNTGQIMESLAARIAKATGKPYLINNFGDYPNSKTLRKELLAAGVGIPDENGDGDVERRLTFPDGSVVDAPVFSGPQYFFKLKQTASQYYGARGRKDAYDVISRKPIKGAKADPLGIYALLSHGATENLKEIGGIKSEKNDEFWRSLETGAALPSPKTTFAMDKLVGLMAGAGINIREEGDTFRMLPMTDRDVDKMSSGEVGDPTKAVRIEKDPGAPIKTFDRGLFDQKLFGGLQGDRYGHITLASPIPNPLFEKPIKALLDLNEEEYDGLIAGSHGVSDGRVIKIDRAAPKDAVLKRGDAFRSLLADIDVESEMESLSQRFSSARKDDRNKIAKKLAYLNGLKQGGLAPTDYVISKVPVIPPMFRPVYLTDKNDMRVSEITAMYQKLGVQNQNAKSAAGLPEEIQQQNFKALYDTVRGLQSDGQTEAYTNRHTAGIMEAVTGSTHKSGQFMSSIFSKREAISGKATIMPDPKLDIDEAKIPEEMAWKMMEPFVMRKMVQDGVPPLDAQKMIERRDKSASKALDLVLEERPVLLTRDPKLHKHNYLAFNASRHPGKSIIIPSLVCAGFNADFDGDRMVAHVPIGPKAVQEAKNKMMPSQNLYKAGRDEILPQPEEDTIAGLFAATKVKRQLDLNFNSPADIEKAYEDGTLKLNDGVKLKGLVTTPGRVLLNNELPADFRDYSMEYTAGNVQKLSQQLAEMHPVQAGKHIKGMNDLGNEFSTKLALSFRTQDFDPIEDKAELQEYLLRTGKRPSSEMNTESVEKKIRAKLGEDSILSIMANSGAKGKWSNMQQMLYSPVKVVVPGGEEDTHVIRRGYAEGMSYRDYISATRGARKGMVDKGVETSKPGEFSKQLLRNSVGMLVQPGEDDEPEGIDYPITHTTVLNRYLAQDVKDAKGKTLAAAGDPVTPALVQMAKKNKVENFNVRSPLVTHASSGYYAKDFGRLPGNKKPQPGTDIGVIAAHTLTEQSTQGMLKKFHAGGSAGSQKSQGFEPVWKLLMGGTPPGEQALMASSNGKVEDIKQRKDGGYDVRIGGKTFHSSAMPMKVAVGDSVKKGDALQEGFLNPRDVLRNRGHRALQTYLVDEIESNFDKGAPDRRYIEAIVGNITRYAEVEDAGDSDFLPGSIVPANSLSRHNERKAGEMVPFKPVRYNPIFAGIGPSAHKTKSDWGTSMIFGHMRQQIPDMAASGATSSKHGPEPYMPFIHSQEFGENIDEGEY